MKVLRALVFLSLVALMAAGASAQMGLYGAPELLPPPSAQPVASEYSAHTVSYGTPAPGPYSGEPQRILYQSAGESQLLPRMPGMSGGTSSQAQVGGMATATPPGIPTPGASAIEPAVPAGGAGGIGCDGGAGCGSPCGTCGLGSCGTCCPWYGSVSALVMTRDRANKLWTTYEADNAPNQIATFRDYDWQWGGQVTLGRHFCCGCDPWSIEATYWGLTDFDNCTSPAQVVPYYSTPFQVGDLDIANHPGSPTANFWFDNSPQHLVWRDSEFHNVELNLVRNQLLGCECGPWNVDWLVGIRYFRFRDHLVFGAQHGPWDMDGNTSPFEGDWIYLNDEIANNLIGMQMGLNAEYRIGCRCKLFVTPKFGVYDNYMTLDYDIHTQDGTHATQTAYPDRQYPIHATHNGFSFLTEVDVGAKWQFSPHWEAMAGYRVVAVTGAGLAENQVPHFGVDTPAVADIDRNGSLILHGAFMGLTFTF